MNGLWAAAICFAIGGVLFWVWRRDVRRSAQLGAAKDTVKAGERIANAEKDRASSLDDLVDGVRSGKRKL